MKPNIAITSIAAGSLLLSASNLMAVIELSVNSVLTPLVGDRATETSVAPNLSQQASFQLDLFDTVALTNTTAYLTVDVDSFGSGLTSHWISDGQDGNTDRIGISLFGDANLLTRTAEYTFTFYSDAAFTTPLNLESFVMQVADIDQLESVSVQDSAFTSIQLGTPTDLSVSSVSGVSTLTNTAGENDVKTNPVAVANFVSIDGLNSFTIGLAGAGPGGREFQFDFTPDIAVPEPSTYALLFGLAALSSLALKRRSRS